MVKQIKGLMLLYQPYQDAQKSMEEEAFMVG